MNDLVLNLGTELIKEIQAEENFPPDYLKNVIEKVTSVKVRYDTAQSKIEKICSEIDFSDYHRNFENQLHILTVILKDCETWLKDFSRRIECDSDSILETEQGTFTFYAYFGSHFVFHFVFIIIFKLINF